MGVPIIDAEDLIAGVEADLREGILVIGSVPIFVGIAACVPNDVDEVVLILNVVVSTDIFVCVLVDIEGVISLIIIVHRDFMPCEKRITSHCIKIIQLHDQHIVLIDARYKLYSQPLLIRIANFQFIPSLSSTSFIGTIAG